MVVAFWFASYVGFGLQWLFKVCRCFAAWVVSDLVASAGLLFDWCVLCLFLVCVIIWIWWSLLRGLLHCGDWIDLSLCF